MKRITRFFLALALTFIGHGALAQTQVYQNGVVTAGNPVVWSSQRFIGDGTLNGGFTNFTLTSTTPTLCIYDALQTTSYHQLCLGAVNAAGTAGTLNYGAFAGASALPFVINANTGTASFNANTLTMGVAATSAGSIVLSSSTAGGSATLSANSLVMAGSTSGAVTIKTGAAAGTFNFFLPVTAGTAGQPLLSGGGSASMTYGTLTGNTTQFVTQSGSSTVNHCPQYDASGNLVDSGSSCASSGVTAGTAGNIPYYATSGSTVGPNTNLNISTAALTVGVAGVSQGSLALTGAASGTITIGVQSAAGTFNFNLPQTAGTSGQVLTSGGGGGAAMTWSANGIAAVAIQNANFNAAVNSSYCIDTTSGAVTMTLPAAPANNDKIQFIDCSSKFGVNALTVSRNGKAIMGLSENMTVNTVNAAAVLVYVSTNNDWRMF